MGTIATKGQRRAAAGVPLGRNPVVRATARHACHAGVAATVDARHKVMRPGKGAGSYVRRRVDAARAEA